MPVNVRLVTDSEVEAGIILKTDDPIILEARVSRDEWDALVARYGFTGVHWEARLDFLKANGYDATRANIRNADLHAKPQD